MNTSESRQLHKADICVVGGGLSGLLAAVAAARHGAKVVLMQDRPMLGGNASSEIRMWVRGAAGLENRETGILQELEMENIYRNPTMNFSQWDAVLYQLACREENLTLLLNCSCLGCDMADGRIQSVTGWQLNSYTFHTVQAKIFMDCRRRGDHPRRADSGGGLYVAPVQKRQPQPRFGHAPPCRHRYE